MAGISLAAAAVAAKTSGDVTGAVHNVIHLLDDTITYHDEVINSTQVLINRMVTSRGMIREVIHSKELPSIMEEHATDTEQHLHDAQMEAISLMNQAPNVTHIHTTVDALHEVNRHRGWATAALLFACALTMALILT
jgi:hypothetical protein